MVGTAVSIAGGTIGATGVGIILGGVLIGVGGVLGAGSVIFVKIEKKILKKRVKHDKLAALAEAKLFSIQDKISKALKDGKISEEDFREINEEMRKHALQRSEIVNDGKKSELQSKNSSSTRELADQLAMALKALTKVRNRCKLELQPFRAKGHSICTATLCELKYLFLR